MKKRRVIRKLPVTSGDYLESHAWPVNLAVFVTAGFLSGVSIAYQMGSVLLVPCLIAIALVTLGLVAAVTLLDRRWLRRTLQLALAIAILFHVALLVGMAEADVFDEIVPRKQVARNDDLPERPVRIPDFKMERVRTEQRPPEPWAAPVPTPEPEERPVEVDRATETPVEPRPQPEPAEAAPETIPDAPRPETPMRETPGEAVPRFSATPSLLSRQSRDVDGPFNPRVAVDVGATAPSSSANAVARATPIERQANASSGASASRAPAEGEPAAAPSQRAIARAEPRAPDAPTAIDAMTEIRRSPTAAETMPRVDLAAEPVPAPTNLATERPRETMVADAARQETVAPSATRALVEPNEGEPRPDATRFDRRTADLEESPALAQTERASLDRRERATPRAVPVAAADVPTPSEAPTPAPAQPAMQVARDDATNPAPAAALSRTASAEAPSSGGPTERPVERSVAAQTAELPAPAVASSPLARATVGSTLPIPGPSTPAPMIASSDAAAGQPGSRTEAAATELSRGSTGAAIVRSEQAGTASSADPPPALAASSPSLNATTRGEGTPGASPSSAALARAEGISRDLPGEIAAGSPGEAAGGPIGDAALAFSPGASDVPRQGTESSLPATVASALAQAEGSVGAEGAAEGSLARTASAEAAPSLASDASDSAMPTRTAQFAPSPVSPGDLDQPALAESQRPSDLPGSEAAPMVLSRGYEGVAGIGEGANIGRDLAADSRQTASTPSGSIARAHATQTGEEGPAVTPSELSRVAQPRATSRAPASTIVAASVPSNAAGGLAASASGDMESAERSASAGAALTTALADAGRGPVTAASGSVEIDLGASRTVAEAGMSRGAGGGQPRLNVQSHGSGPARRDAGGAPRPTIAAATVGPIAAGPRGGAGSGSSSVAEQATALARADGGGASPLVGGPVSANGTGGSDVAAPGPAPGGRAVARASSRQTLPGETIGGAIAGGGEVPGGTPGRAALAANGLAGGTLGAPVVAEIPTGAAGGSSAGSGTTPGAVAAQSATLLARSGSGAGAAMNLPAIGGAAEAGTSGSGGARIGEGALARAASTNGDGGPSIGTVASATPSPGRAASSVAGIAGPTAAFAPLGMSLGSAPSTSGPAVETLARDVGGPGKTETSQGGGGLAGSRVAGPGVPSDTLGGERVGAVAIGRAESSPGAVGPALPGGGRSVARSSRDPSVPTLGRAEAIQLAGSPGGTTGESYSSQAGASDAARLSGGVATGTAIGEGGGLPDVGDLASDAPRFARTEGAAPRVGAGNGDSPELAAGAGVSSIARARESSPYAPGSVAIDVPDATPVGLGTGAGSDVGMAAPGDMGDVGRQAAGGALALVAAPEGMGGVGMRPAPAGGIDSPRATQSDAPILLATGGRFPGKQARGSLSLDATATYSAPSFRGRGRPDMTPGAGPGGAGGPKTEKSVEEGIGFLVRHQMPDGSWSLHRFGDGRIGYEGETASMASDTAATGLAILALQGAGYTHREHRHRESVQRGLAWLIARQKQDGDLFVAHDAQSGAGWLYSHGIAALALTEAYGMTHDPALREPAQKALDFIVASQEKQLGGWRYSPGSGADTSVTGWMSMALKSGELAGLKVPSETYVGVRKWLDYSQVRGQTHLYRYNPYASDTPEQRHGRAPTPSMTSVGLLMRMYLGWQRDDPQLQAGAAHLLENLPRHGTVQEYREGKNPRDTYYWYYATQVMYHMGGDAWKTWHERLHPMLLETQIPDGPMAGSWDPASPIPDRWGPHGGRLYVTAMNILSLEVEYRHLPLYVETAK